MKKTLFLILLYLFTPFEKGGRRALRGGGILQLKKSPRHAKSAWRPPFSKGVNSYILFFLVSFYTPFSFALLHIVAAENVYGSVVEQLGGSHVEVTHILNNPSSDPHLFSTSPSTAKSINVADIIVYNGADYDPWMNPLLKSSDIKQKQIINVAELVNVKSGENPHIWYDPKTMPKFAAKIVGVLSQLDPNNKTYYQTQLKAFLKEDQAIQQAVTRLRKRFKNMPVIATESVFNYMIDAIGLDMQGLDFQQKVMNDIPPTISEIKDFEQDLRTHAVHVMIYNDQVINPLTTKMLTIAEEERIPVVGVSEMMPANTKYVSWILGELGALEKALQGKFAE